MMTQLETERLILKPYIKNDFDAFTVLRSDENVMEYMWGGTLSVTEAQQQFDGYLKAWVGMKYGMWAVFDRETGTYIGEAGYWQREDCEGLTLRYLLHKTWWGRGLASEAVNAVLDYGFSAKVGIRKISALAYYKNTQSCRVLERAGLTLQEMNFNGIEGFRRYTLSA